MIENLPERDVEGIAFLFSLGAPRRRFSFLRGFYWKLEDERLVAYIQQCQRRNIDLVVCVTGVVGYEIAHYYFSALSRKEILDEVTLMVLPTSMSSDWAKSSRFFLVKDWNRQPILEQQISKLSMAEGE